MTKTIKLMAAFLGIAAAAALSLPISGYSQDTIATKQVIAPVSGEIVSIDAVGSTIVVKQLKDAVTGTYENTIIAISQETVINKGEAAITLAELKAGDKVTVVYKAGTSEVESISVQTQA